MMTLNYGVCTKESALRKGYGYIVPQLLDKEKGSTANAAPWDDCFLNQYIAEPQDRHYESFVGQPSGDSLAFLRCSALSFRPQASSTQDEKFAFGFSAFSRSTLESISSINSCGKRIPFVADLLFTARVAIEQSPNCARTPYRKFTGKKSIDVPQHLDLKCPNTINVHWCKIAKPGSVGTLTGLLTKPLIEVTIMACSHDTQTRTKFVYLFLGTPNEFPDSTPTVLRAEADTEDDARAKFPRWTLTFAAQIRTAAPCRLQIFSTDDGFMWVYEQRQAAQEEAHA